MSPKIARLDSLLGRTAALAALGALAAGCALEAGAPAPRDEDPDLYERLASPTAFDVDLPSSAAEVVAVTRGEEEAQTFEIPIVEGTAVARVTGADELVLEQLALDLGDVTIPAELVPPEGFPLKDIRVALERPTGAPLDDLGDMIATAAEIDVVVEWAGEFEEGRTYPLRTMRLEGLPVSLEIERGAEGGLRAHLTAVRQGAFWAWADLFELRDLTVDLALVSRK